MPLFQRRRRSSAVGSEESEVMEPRDYALHAQILEAEVAATRKKSTNLSLILLLGLVLAVAYFVLFVVYVVRGPPRNTIVVDGKNTSVWTYLGNTAPAFWGDVLPEYQDIGGLQSPIDVSPDIAPGYEFASDSNTRNLSQILNLNDRMDFEVTSFDNNITYFRCREQECGNMTVGYTADQIFTYQLREFHLHAPGEHTLYNLGPSMELQLHFELGDRIAGILAVFFRMTPAEGASNESIGRLIDQSEAYREDPTAEEGAFTGTLRSEDFINATSPFFSYAGSLTVPPCTEGVIWILQKEAQNVSVAQYNRWYDLVSYPGNRRQVQPLNSRRVNFFGRNRFSDDLDSVLGIATPPPLA